MLIMLRIIISILVLVLSLGKLFAADIPVIVIAPSKKAQSLSTVGSSVTVYDQEHLFVFRFFNRLSRHNRWIISRITVNNLFWIYS